jgi:hypothetical protein
MLNNILSLSFSIYSKKGVYALLLGSGISRSAGIPTGWEIVLDLIQKIAKISAEDSGSNHEEWYKSKFKEEPNYSKLCWEGFANAYIKREIISL